MCMGDTELLYRLAIHIRSKEAMRMHKSSTIYCKSFEVEKFHGLIGNRETFPVK